MKKLLLVLFLAALSLNCEGQQKKAEVKLGVKEARDEVTTYYFIRHAEKDLQSI